MKKWYLVQVKRNAHFLAQRNLIRQGFETFIPLQLVTTRKASRFISERKPLFPGYIFVKLDVVDSPWRKINNTIGVARLVTVANLPKSLPCQLISNLISRCDESGNLQKSIHLQDGKKIKFLSGPFANFVGTVESIEVEKRIWILTRFMGQSTRVAVASDQLTVV